MQRLLVRGVLLVLVLGVVMAATPAGSAMPGEVRVVTSIFPYADIAQRIGGEHVEVNYFLPPGASPHTFEPRPGQMRDVARADLAIVNGAQLDEWAQEMIASANPDVPRLVLADAVPLLPYRDHDHGDESGHGDDHGDHDPHFWLDPVLMRDVIAPAIAEALTAAAPARADSFAAHLAHLQDELTQLDEEIRAAVAELQQRRFIGYHSAWRYFAERYGLEEVAAVATFPGQEPSARWLSELVTMTRELGVRVVFAEPQLNPQAAQVIASEIGGEILLMDPLGGHSVEGRDGYLELMRFNVEALSAALR